MATLARQPFAPLDGARLQALTSTKNRQNAAPPLASKRKAPVWNEAEDVENVDPHLTAKRSKGVDGVHGGLLKKQPAFTLTKAGLASVSDLFDAKPRPLSAAASPRPVLHPRAPSSKVAAAAKVRSSPIRSPVVPSSLPSSLPSLPGGGGSSRTARPSPIRAARRGGLLSSKRRAASNLLARSSPSAPAPTSIGSAAPFSLDAALKGTLSSFDARLAAAALPTPALRDVLDDATGMRASWIFDIHEDTPEQEMTNLLQHSTCVLDISSDEESEQKARRERAEGRDKENIPPPNDASQTSAARSAAAAAADDMPVDKARNPLGQLNAADFYAAGCDEASVVLVASDEAEEEEAEAEAAHHPAQEPEPLSIAAVVQEAAEAVPAAAAASVDEIMGHRETPAPAAALLEPIDGTGESFQLWESGSQKDEDL